MKRISWITSPSQANLTLEKILREQYGLSRRQVIRLKRQPGSVLVNGAFAPVVQKLEPGDLVEVAMEEHLAALPPEDIPLEIVFEDQDIIVINKPAGLVSHPTKGYTGGTLANALAGYWQQKGERFPARLITRLDKETSGLVLAAKNAYTHHRLSEAKIRKTYLALTQGIPSPIEGAIDLPLGRSMDNPSKRGVDPQGKAALTRYWTENAGNGLALVRLEPVTGRTHQLRIHMASIGCPLIDDYMYGEAVGTMGRTALHAHKLEFIHPNSQEHMVFMAPLPPDMTTVLTCIDPNLE